MSRAGENILGVVIFFAMFSALFYDCASILAPLRVEADFNRNGTVDLAIADMDEAAVSVSLTTPDGQLVLNRTYPLSGSPQAILAADLNGNGVPDLATANGPEGTVSVLLNRGDGTFESPRTYHVSVLGPFRITANDFDLDGIVDLIVSDARGNRSILLGNGDGTFRVTD